MLHIPVTVTGNSSIEVTLDGEVFEIYTKYNQRNKRVYMDILKDGVQIIAGAKLLEGFEPIFPYVFEGLPVGEFLVGILQATAEQATVGNIGFGLDYSLLYITESEIGG